MQSEGALNGSSAEPGKPWCWWPLWISSGSDVLGWEQCLLPPGSGSLARAETAPSLLHAQAEFLSERFLLGIKAPLCVPCCSAEPSNCQAAGADGAVRLDRSDFNATFKFPLWQSQWGSCLRMPARSPWPSPSPCCQHRVRPGGRRCRQHGSCVLPMRPEQQRFARCSRSAVLHRAVSGSEGGRSPWEQRGAWQFLQGLTTLAASSHCSWVLPTRCATAAPCWSSHFPLRPVQRVALGLILPVPR